MANSFTALSKRLEDKELPLLICGPIVRTTVVDEGSIWIARLYLY